MYVPPQGDQNIVPRFFFQPLDKAMIAFFLSLYAKLGYAAVASYSVHRHRFFHLTLGKKVNFPKCQTTCSKHPLIVTHL